MTKKDMAKLFAFLTALYPNIEIKQGTVEAWHEMIGDLPYDMAKASFMKVLAEQQFPCMPAVGKIREAAAYIQNPSRLSPAEAWEKVRTAMQDYGYYRAAEGFASLPPTVQKTVRALGGFSTICASENPEATRGHFLKIYEQFAEREKELSVLPPSVREFLSDGIKLLPGVN